MSALIFEDRNTKSNLPLNNVKFWDSLTIYKTVGRNLDMRYLSVGIVILFIITFIFQIRPDNQILWYLRRHLYLHQKLTQIYLLQHKITIPY
jgi:hypothetical protein